MSGALSGITIADFSRVLAGPYATMMLADLGADVIKIEHPDKGDDSRSWGPPYAADSQSTYFHSVNRNKRSVGIDLKTEQGRAQARQIAATADVLVENFPPGTMAKFGLDFETLSGLNPRLVYCSISGFGSTDAGAALPGYDLLIQAVGGLMSITGEPDQPTKVGVALVDVITGLHAVMAIEAALLHRHQTGRGQKVELTLLSSLLSAMVNQSAAWVGAGVVPRALGNAHPSIVPYQQFSASDGDFVVAVGNNLQFAALCTAIGLEALIEDEKYATNTARVAHRDELVAILNNRFAQQSVSELVAALSSVRVPAGPINSIAQAFEWAQTLGLEPVITIDGLPTVAHPVTYSDFEVRYRSSPPPLGNADE